MPPPDPILSSNPTLSSLSDDPVYQSVASVASLHVQAEERVDPHQRLVERLTRLCGRPGFFYGVAVASAVWVGGNLLSRLWGHGLWDVPPFFWLQSVAGVSAFLLSVMILTTQNRQARLAERRAQLDLQINLLTEQKVAKLIALVEELRRDMPQVANRHDPEAMAMTEAADPAAVLNALEETLDEASEAQKSEAQKNDK